MTEPARFPSMRLQISYIGGMLAGALCWLMMVPVHAQDRDALRSGASSDTTQSTGTVFTAPSRVDTLNVVGGGPFLVRPFMEAGSERIRVNGSHVGNDAYLLDARKGLITLRDIAPDSSIMPCGILTSIRRGPSAPVIKPAPQPRPDAQRLQATGWSTTTVATPS